MNAGGFSSATGTAAVSFSYGGPTATTLFAPAYVTRPTRPADIYDDFDRCARELRKLDESIAAFREACWPPGLSHRMPPAPRELRAVDDAVVAERAFVIAKRRRWLTGRRGAPRETRPARTRRRLRTWERETECAPSIV